MEENKKNQLDRVIIKSINYFEAQLFNTVMSGSEEKVEELKSVGILLLISRVPKSAGREAYILIPLLTIITRSAIRGGADPVEVFEYYRKSLKAFQNVRTEEEFCSFFSDSAEKYRICAKEQTG